MPIGIGTEDTWYRPDFLSGAGLGDVMGRPEATDIYPRPSMGSPAPAVNVSVPPADAGAFDVAARRTIVGSGYPTPPADTGFGATPVPTQRDYMAAGISGGGAARSPETRAFNAQWAAAYNRRLDRANRARMAQTAHTRALELAGVKAAPGMARAEATENAARIRAAATVAAVERRMMAEAQDAQRQGKYVGTAEAAQRKADEIDKESQIAQAEGRIDEALELVRSANAIRLKEKEAEIAALRKETTTTTEEKINPLTGQTVPLKTVTEKGTTQQKAPATDLNRDGQVDARDQAIATLNEAILQNKDLRTGQPLTDDQKSRIQQRLKELGWVK